jgi:hypothetical protein
VEAPLLAVLPIARGDADDLFDLDRKACER